MKLPFRMPDSVLPDYVKVDPNRMRPAEVDVLLGDPGKAEKKMGVEGRGKLGGIGG